MVKENAIPLSWSTEKRKVSELVAWNDNSRKMTDEQRAQLLKSLQKFNLAEIPAINTDNSILAGHQRVAALILQGRGDESIDVRVPNRALTEQEATEYRLRSNHTTAEWDWGKLKKFELSFLKDIGFGSFDMDKTFLRFAKEDNFDAQKEYDAIEEPETKPGDLYILGNHRLLCGSSADEKDFDRLMDGMKAHMIFTDPPYNVNYKSPDGLSYDSKKYGGTGGQIFNDNLSDKDYAAFYTAVLKNLYKHSTDDASIYWWFANSNNLINSIAFIESGWKQSQTIMWLKESHVVSRSQDYHHSYEPCMFGWKKGKAHYKDKKVKNYNDVIKLDKETFAEYLDVWYERRDNTATYLHPTQKPIRLSERAIKRNSKDDDIIVDGFGGSGSMLMGCEQLGRRAFVMELDPKYCDVIVKRWELYTGKKAQKIGG